MIKRIKNKHLLSSKTNDVSKNPIRVLYKKVGQPSEVKIISDVYKLKKAIIERSLDIIPYEKIFIICHSKKSNSNMFPNIFLPLKRILGDLIVVNIDKKEREFKSLSQEDIIWYSKDINNKSPKKVDIKSSNIKKVIPITDVYEKAFKNNGYFTSKNFEQILFEILIHLNLVLAKILKNNGDDKK
ncbi:MAG: hypothetical protein BHW00_02000 [Clostridium sp. 26_22]|jgi:hypothetical protein|uniref:hypothetical protein n=1 Tax=Candidatus Merdicola sp. TaxID=3085652 RepID=UPI00095EE719|nr:MAG: hypothetical protein BHW00_02000 [Clostridium sp. 26_22]